MLLVDGDQAREAELAREPEERPVPGPEVGDGDAGAEKMLHDELQDHQVAGSRADQVGAISRVVVEDGRASELVVSIREAYRI